MSGAARLLAVLLLPLLPPQEDGQDQARPSAGPMVGFVAPDRARIWVQADRPGWVGVEVQAAGSSTWLRNSDPSGQDRRFHFDADRDFAVVCEVEGLQPATRYRYRLFSRQGPLEAESEQSFRTPPLPGTAEDLTVAFGSCASHWGPKPEQPIFLSLDRLHPDLFLWLGDNVYFEREFAEWTDPEKMNARYRRQRALPNLQPFLRRTPQLATWDDHDYGPNNSDKLYPLKARSLGFFARYWANGGYGSDGWPGVWQRFRWGRVGFFLLDLRSWREPAWRAAGPGKTQLGAPQWAWLERALAESDADFKVIVSSVQVLARYHRFESWDPYPEDRRRLIGLIRREKVGGVLLLSGDRHLGEILSWKPPEAPYPLYDFTSSPLAAGVGRPLADEEVADRVPGTGVGQENFGLLRFRFGGPEGPEVRLSAHGEDGAVLYPPLRLRLSDLQP